MKKRVSYYKHLSIVLLFGFFLIISKCTAQTNTFNNASGGNDWEVAGNWSLGHIPISGEDVVIAANCTINTTTAIPAAGTLKSLTVNLGMTLAMDQTTGTFTINATTINVTGTFNMDGNPSTVVINATTLNVAGKLQNDAKNVIATINVSGNVNVSSIGFIDLGDTHVSSAAGNGTTINIGGNVLSTSDSCFIHHTGGATPDNINFTGSNVIQTLTFSTNNWPDKLSFSVNGSNNSLQMEQNITLSGKSTVSVSSGDTLDCQTFFLSGMTSAGNGNFTLNSGAAIKIGSAEGVNGNISSSIATITLNGGSNTFVYSGTANQVQGSLLPATVLNLTMHNTGGTENNGVTLSQPVTVTGQLTLDDGIVETNSTDILNLTNSAVTTCPGGNAISYVAGPMTETGATSSFVFPTGSFSSSSVGANRWARIGITAPPTLSNTITAQYTYTTPINPYSVNPPLANVSTLEYWTLSESVATDAVTPKLYWQSGPASGIYTYTSTPLLVADYSTGGSVWNSLGGAGVTGASPGAGTITATSSITGFSSLPVTFGSTIYSSDPLPITLTSFTANYEEENNSVLINWTAAVQLNNKEFVIEKTVDGSNYTVIDTIAGAGTTSVTKLYSTVDNNPTFGTSYYRLIQIDFYGTPTIFPPAPVFVGAIAINGSVNIYPNPVATNATITYISEDSHPITVNIIDITGRVISSFINNQIQTGENNFSLNTSNLSEGIYLVRIVNGQKTYYNKFIKQ